MSMSKKDAWEVLGGRGGPFGAWENLNDNQRADLWRQMPDNARQAIWTIFGDQPEVLPEQPPAESGRRSAEVYIDIQTAFAIAKRSGLTRDDVLAAIGMGEIEGVDPRPGLKELPRAPFIAWLEDNELVDDDEPEVLGEFELDGKMIKVINSDEARDFGPLPPPTLEERLDNLKTVGALLVIVLGIVFIFLCFKNV